VQVLGLYRTLVHSTLFPINLEFQLESKESWSQVEASRKEVVLVLAKTPLSLFSS
jgi:hypothetical protein